MPNPGGHFKFRVGQRVIYKHTGQRVKIVNRTTEAALGKTYQIMQKIHGRYIKPYVPEEYLEEETR